MSYIDSNNSYFNICAVPLFYLVSSSYFWKALGGRAHELTNARFWASSYNGSHHFRPYDWGPCSGLNHTLKDQSGKWPEVLPLAPPRGHCLPSHPLPAFALGGIGTYKNCTQPSPRGHHCHIHPSCSLHWPLKSHNNARSYSTRRRKCPFCAFVALPKHGPKQCWLVSPTLTGYVGAALTFIFVASALGLRQVDCTVLKPLLPQTIGTLFLRWICVPASPFLSQEDLTTPKAKWLLCKWIQGMKESPLQSGPLELKHTCKSPASRPGVTIPQTPNIQEVVEKLDWLPSTKQAQQIRRTWGIFFRH